MEVANIDETLYSIAVHINQLPKWKQVYEQLDDDPEKIRYLSSYGYIYLYFLNLDELGNKEEDTEWFFNFLTFVCDNIPYSKSEKLISQIEKSILAKNNNREFIERFLTKYGARYLRENFPIERIENETLLGYHILSAKSRIPNNEKCISEELESRYDFFNDLYLANEEDFMKLFTRIYEYNISKSQITTDTLHIDLYNTYQFLINIFCILLNVLCSNYDLKDVKIEGNEGNGLYTLLIKYYKISYSSIILQITNANTALIYDPNNPTLKSHIQYNKRFFTVDVYSDCVFNFFRDMIDDYDYLDTLDDDDIFNVLFYLDFLVEYRIKKLSSVTQRAFYQYLSHIIFKKTIKNPYVKIKAFKTIYLMVNHLKFNLEKQANFIAFYQKLIELSIYIDKMPGLDNHVDRYFYKNNILEILVKYENSEYFNKSYIVIMMNDIEDIVGYLTSTIKTILLATNEPNAFLKCLAFCDTYLGGIKMRMEYIAHNLNTTILPHTDLKYHLIKAIYVVCKTTYDIERFMIIKKDSVRIMDKFAKNLFKPLISQLETVFKYDGVINLINQYYSDLPKYLKHIDREFGTDFIEQIRVLRINAVEELPENLPEEFMDPLLYTPIRIPVILPSSNIFVDKTVIDAHLVENNYDPFNRMPLTEEELAAYNELEEQKERCIDFIRRRDQWIESNRCHLQNELESQPN